MFVVHPPCLQFLTLEQGVFLAALNYVWNLCEFHMDSVSLGEEEEDEYPVIQRVKGLCFFSCSVKDICEQLYINKQTERRLMKSLVDLEIVIKKRVGLPSTRYIAINEKQLKRLLKKARANGQ